MDVRTLQQALNTRGVAKPPLDADDVAGKRTMAAVEALARRSGAEFGDWTDARLLIAAEQAVYKDLGIYSGVVDGLIGPQTKYAQTVWAGRELTNGDPNPAVEDWRAQREATGPAPKTTAAHRKWPKQKDVQAFFGRPGDGSLQVMLDIPFPMRLAWDLKVEVQRFSCHKLVRDSLASIWKRTLEHYGHDEIKRLRLDRYGGCLNVRKKRGGTTWSMHAWGIAQDVDPDRNALGMHRAQATLDDPAYAPFWGFVYDEGALSLGLERDFDWMHFQFTRDLS